MLEPSDDWALIAQRLQPFGDANTPDELARHVIFRAGSETELNTFLALASFKKTHEHDTKTAVQSAMLLVTDIRCSSISLRLMTQMAESGIVPDEDLDVLAESFARCEDIVYWRCRPEWIADGTVGRVDGTVDPLQEAAFERVVPHGARRWAIGWLVGRDASNWGGLYALANEATGARHEAMMLGILDAADALTPEAADFLAIKSIGSTRGPLRHAGLRRLAAKNPDAAIERSQVDPNAAIRTWGAKLADKLAARKPPPAPTPAEEPPPPAESMQSAQPSLFDEEGPAPG